MGTSSRKVYAVFQGHQPGLYTSWDETSKQVKGFKGAVYKSFPDREKAIYWLREKVLAASEPVDNHLITLIKNMEHSGSTSTADKSKLPNGLIVIHTDGGASPNPGKGGYGVVLQKGSLRREMSAGYELTTNNRMELLACIVALETLKEPSEVMLHTDSRYVVDSITKKWVYGWQKRGWKKSDGKAPENIDLWQRLLPLLKRHRVTFKWVRGHAGNRENERCDALVSQARQSEHLLQDTGYTAAKRL